ncbi:hypothetical protein [Limosilactobacillus reuteri]|uniref:hypothetical protein n=1 Tax=Limosilactobacillus reuteri TaxID=1598 RepID=UPI001E293753|nr:hypothetical protein [Limosilactobacillus reuteri]MCC4369354.1 hypothetical protein [Limosilactobacillus reuteri]
MKVHYINSKTPEEFDKNVNEFIEGKKIIDIKPYPIIDTNVAGGIVNNGLSDFYLDCVVMYEEEE